MYSLTIFYLLVYLYFLYDFIINILHFPLFALKLVFFHWS